MAKEDFLVGLLQGLYQGGVGNPEVNRQNRMSDLEEAYYRQNMATKAMDQGLMPSNDIHPQTTNIIKSILFPGNGDSMQTAFVPDPNAQSGYVSPSGDLSTKPIDGGIRLSPGQYRETLMSKAKQPTYNLVQPGELGQSSTIQTLPKGNRPVIAPRPYISEEQKVTEREMAKLKVNMPKEKKLLNNALSNFDRMIQEAEAIKNHKSLGAATGLSYYGAKLAKGTAAYNAIARINTLKSKTGFQVLQELRNNSPTGGALGQISDRENQLLQENISSLDPLQSTNDFKDSLDRIIQYAKGAKTRLQSAYDETYSGMSNSKQSLIPNTIQNKSGSKPQTIRQNGFIYNLNPLTGQYE